MSKLIEKTGNLFDSDAPAYAHGVNTRGLMGAGIAVEFKHRWPDMYKVYKNLCKDEMLLPGGYFPYVTKERTIINIASQDLPGPHAKLQWFEEGLSEALAYADWNNIQKIAMPRIGCGIGGLDWADVRDIIEYFAEEGECDIEVWSL